MVGLGVLPLSHPPGLGLLPRSKPTPLLPGGSLCVPSQSCAYLLHWGNRVRSFSRIFSSLSTGGLGNSEGVLTPPNPGGGGREGVGITRAEPGREADTGLFRP